MDAAWEHHRRIGFRRIWEDDKDPKERKKNITACVHQSYRLIHLCMLYLSTLIGKRLANHPDDHRLSDAFYYEDKVFVQIETAALLLQAIFYDSRGGHVNTCGIYFSESDLDGLDHM